MHYKKKIGLIIFLGFQIGFISVLKNYPEFVEKYYSNAVYVALSKFLRFIFGWLPFSFGDVLYALVVIYILRWLFVKRKHIITDIKHWLLDVGAALSVVYFVFHLLWAYNYYRLPLHQSLQIETVYTNAQLLDFTEQLIEKSNLWHSKLSCGNDSLKIELPYTKSEILQRAPQGYAALSQRYPHLSYSPVSIKKSIYSLPLTYAGFSGYLNPFTNEAQVDGLIPTYKFPTTACHEIAHQLGYAAENEANFIGSLAAMHHSDPYFKYAGYTFALQYCLLEIYKRDPETYKVMLSKIHLGILRNYRENQEFWAAYKNPLEPIFEKTFDTFLKINNQAAGVESYSYVVALLVNYFEINAL